jgi:hypothetical protein
MDQICTVEQIRAYLITSFNNLENGPVKFYKNKKWIQKYGFRRAFHIHCVFVNEETDEHIFYVSEDDWNTENDPDFGVWKSFDAMVDGVAKRYAILWKLNT